MRFSSDWKYEGQLPIKCAQYSVAHKGYKGESWKKVWWKEADQGQVWGQGGESQGRPRPWQGDDRRGTNKGMKRKVIASPLNCRWAITVKHKRHRGMYITIIPNLKILWIKTLYIVWMYTFSYILNRTVHLKMIKTGNFTLGIFFFVYHI